MEKKNIEINEKIWRNENLKWEMCKRQYQSNNNSAFVVWFEETFEKLTSIFSQAGLPEEAIFLARQAAHHSLQNIPVIFAEHYPLRKKEAEFYEKFQLTNITIYSSLDEPFFKHFATNDIEAALKQANLPDHQPNLVSFIKTMQEKISETVVLEIPAKSQADWLMKNITA